MVNAHRVPAKPVLTLAVYLATTSPLLATHYYVKTNGSDSADGLSWATAFVTVGKAITVSVNGDTVDVNEGTYYERINYSGKRIHIRSTDPNDPATVAATIINANSTTLNAVTFSSGENSSAILDGFTVRSGKYGVYCTSSSSPTVKHCVIRNNSSYGVSLTGGSPPINDCEIRENGSYGVYVYCGSGPITRCRILSNTGGGFYCYSYSGTIKNCVIAKNGGYGVNLLSGCSASVLSCCTFVSNTTRGICGTSSSIKNCILWGNGDDLAGSSATYSCIEDQDTGTGIIHGLPMFVNAAADDYHLWYTSPCVDAGDPSSSYANEPNGGGGRIDMGAYGDTPEATTIIDTDADGLDDRWETTYWPGQDLNLHGPNDDPDGDGLRNKDEYYIHWDPTLDDSASVIGLVHNARVDVNYPSISLALSTAANDDTLTLAASTFVERINFNGKPVHLRSSDPNNASGVAATIINGNSTSQDTVTFNMGETASAILDGITIRGGRYGINCASSAPTVKHCVVRNNSSYGVYLNGNSPPISDCEIRENGSYGMYVCGSAPVTRCRILSNTGGGVYGYNYHGTIKNCVIAKNGGYGVNLLSGCSASVFNCCTLVSNTTRGICGTSSSIKNCILWGNGDDLAGSSATYSCIEDQDSGTGIIHILPMFMDAANDDYHLKDWSRCIDSGDPSSDYSLEPNGGGGRINMGAYGNTSEAETLRDSNGDGVPEGWLEYYWPGYNPNDPNYSAGGDPDMDDFNNVVEYLFGTAPNQATNANLTLIVGLSGSAFNPTNHETARLIYLVNVSASVTVTVTSTSTAEIVYACETPVSAGRHEAIWNGCDPNGRMVEHGTYSIFIEANDGIGHTANTTFTVTLNYVHDIVNMRIDPSCFIPANNEVTTIAYQLTADANMVVEVYDPRGALWGTLLDNVSQSQGPHELIWQGRTKPLGDPQGRWVSQEGVYTIRIRFAGMREKEEDTVHAVR